MTKTSKNTKITWITKITKIMTQDGLYKRAYAKLEELIPMVKGETLTREEIYRLCDININNLDHAPFKKAINDVLYNWTVVNKKQNRVARNGRGFKFVDDNLVPINFKTGGGSKFDMWLPFNISKLCFLYRKNIMMVIGSKDAGKTALLINIAKNNMAKHRTLYFSSEMVDAELRGRLSKFEDMSIYDWNIEAYERSYDFHEVIDPDGLNLIDFLELGGEDGTEYYRGVAMIRKIYDKLENGVAVIACQKNKDADLPKGGSGMLEKARIALSLDPNTAKLIVAKNWQEGITSSPKGTSWTYSLVGGVNYVNVMEVYDE